MSRTNSNGQPRIAVLAPRMSVLGYEPCGGSEVMLWEDVRLLQNAGISVQVYGSAAKETAPVHTIPLHTNLPLVTSLEYCASFIWRERNSLLMACNEPTVAGLIPDRAVVRFEWSTPLPRYWKLPGWLSRFRRARYLFLSHNDRGEFLRSHPLIPIETTCAIPYYVDRELFRPARQRVEGPLRVGFAGQWVSRKGCLALLEAWQIARIQCPKVELRFAGSDKLWKAGVPTPGSAEVAEKIREAAAQGYVKIVGELKRAEMPHFWNSLDIAVVPSFEEPFGLVALEALACGVPVVASAVGGLKEIIEDGKSGLLVPPGDEPALAQALIKLLTDEPLRLRLADGAVRRAKEYSIERRSRDLLKFLTARRQAGLY